MSPFRHAIKHLRLVNVCSLSSAVLPVGGCCTVCDGYLFGHERHARALPVSCRNLVALQARYRHPHFHTNGLYCGWYGVFGCDRSSIRRRGLYTLSGKPGLHGMS